MKEKIIALVKGDGAAPEMMNEACKIVIEAAKKDDVKIVFEETPMGWNAYEKYGDTLPPEKFKKAKEIGTIFFGGVGDTKMDKTIGVEKPHLKPEARCLLQLREDMGLLLNFRPVIYLKELSHIAKVRPESIPEDGINQTFIRFLLEGSYFGNKYMTDCLGVEEANRFNIKMKDDVIGDENIIIDIAYYKKETVEKYARAAFKYAAVNNLPVISIDKSNAIPRYAFWKKIITRIQKEEFPSVPLKHQYVDSANALLFTPAELNGVIMCGNEHGDILSDGAVAALGSMGLMCSSAINPDTGAAMFESGAGTACNIAGQDIANPIGRIWTGAMMLKHIGCINGAKRINDAVAKVLKEGYRTKDIVSPSTHIDYFVGTKMMGEKILSYL
jgi:3-isopropylmalate dehydrogenase